LSKHPAHTLTLVADIGGTNTRVALADGTELLPQTVRKYRNHGVPDLETVVRRYLSDEGGVDCAGACIAVAGPVREGVGEMTNIDWSVDRGALARATSAKNVAILNDLQAQAHALGHLNAAALRQVKSGTQPSADAAKLVIGIGTGFNAAPLFRTQGGPLVPPSESGHVSLPIRNAADLRLADYIKAEHGFPAIEDVLSGRGLERIYHWLGHEAGDARTKSAADIMAGVSDGFDPRAEKAGGVFVRILGTVAGDLALIHLPFGGIYLSGGVARSIAPHLDRLGFAAAFRDKGRFSGFMDNFSISVIEDDSAALIGCACYLAAQN
jgi:glucokinase